jgi:hypothetical protein
MDTFLQQRLAVLERSRRRFQIALVCLGFTTAAVLLVQSLGAQGSAEILRGRGLIIEDSNGRPRIVFGAPIPDDGRKTNLRTGMRINDANGVERLGLNLFDDDRLVMGFDAPRGKGDDRNRERISIVADQEGGAYIRFLDRGTYETARMYLDRTIKCGWSSATVRKIRRFGGGLA